MQQQIETIERIERARKAEQNHVALVIIFRSSSNTENFSFSSSSVRKTYAEKLCVPSTYAPNNRSHKNLEPSRNSSIKKPRKTHSKQRKLSHTTRASKNTSSRKHASRSIGKKKKLASTSSSSIRPNRAELETKKPMRSTA
jgi:hypothetical protein